MRKNRIVNIKRQISIDYTGAPSIEIVKSFVGAWVQFVKDSFVTEEGTFVSSDAIIRVESYVDMRERDIIEVLPDTDKKYRVENIEEVFTAGGRLEHLSAVLVRDASIEV